MSGPVLLFRIFTEPVTAQEYARGYRSTVPPQVRVRVIKRMVRADNHAAPVWVVVARRVP